VSAKQSSQEAGIPVVGLASSLFAQSYASCIGDSVPGVPFAQFIAGFLFTSLLAGWIVRDSLRRGKRRPYDFDTMVALLWMFAAPLYLLKTRRWRGALMIVVAIVVAALIDIAASQVITAAWGHSP